MVTYDAFVVWVIHARKTHEGNTSHAKQERYQMSWQVNNEPFIFKKEEKEQHNTISNMVTAFLK